MEGEQDKKGEEEERRGYMSEVPSNIALYVFITPLG